MRNSQNRTIRNRSIRSGSGSYASHSTRRIAAEKLYLASSLIGLFSYKHFLEVNWDNTMGLLFLCTRITLSRLWANLKSRKLFQDDLFCSAIASIFLIYNQGLTYNNRHMISLMHACFCIRLLSHS